MRRRTLLAGLAVATVAPACDSVPLLAPTQSTVRLVVADASIPTGGSTTVTAAVTEAAGTPVHDGTVVTFSTTLGVVDPPEAPTERGRASATFTAGPRSGTAEVVAYSGGAVSEPVEVTIGAAAVASVEVTARPGSLPPAGGTAAVVATVLDASRNRLPNVRVTFSATAGALRARVATTDPSGEARTALTTTAAAEVTASVGEVSGTTLVAVDAATAISISAAPERPVAGQVVSFEVTLTNETRAIRSATIDFGDGRSHALGAPARATVGHAYAAAGAYTVRVAATDVAGQAAAASIVVHVDPAPGIPVTVAATPADPVAGQAVTFTVELSPPENAPAVREVTIDFGDDSRESLGARSNRMSAVHVYPQAASYVVTVTVSDAADRRHASSTVVTVRPPPAIPVTVTSSPSEPVAGQPVTFTVEVSPPAGAPEVREVTVDYGDGSRASLGAVTGRRSLVHVYDAAGSYTVTVTVRDAAGRRHGSSTAVEVRSAPGIPVTVTASPPEPVAGQAVTFTVEVSPPAGAPEVREVTVDFGDDSTASLGAVTGRRSLVHVYDAAGSYTVTVTVRDAAGRRHGSSTAVEVRSAPGIPVTVTASPPEPVAGQAVTFTVEVSPPAGAPEVREVTVDFGDDSTASLGTLTGRRSLVHVYDAAGSYVVTVTVRDAAGRRHESSIAVQVRPAPAISVTVAAVPVSPVAGQPVTFTVQVSPPAGAPEVREVTVDFGDDSTASLGAVTGRRSLVHVYDAAGSYVATATVQDAAGRRHRSSIAVVVRVLPAIPVRVTPSPADPVVGVRVTFTVEVSPAPEAPAVRSVTIDFGDGSATRALGVWTGRRFEDHIYETVGRYTVTATVRDAAGRDHAASTVVNVVPKPEELR